jgi:hypothetical protein
MSCITQENKRCTKCCEAIHVNKAVWPTIMRGGGRKFTDQHLIRKYWIPISRRRAKKINPYIFENAAQSEDNYLKNFAFFKCKALIRGFGCSIRDTVDHPQVCKIYTGGDEYSPTCSEDINIIARST